MNKSKKQCTKCGEWRSIKFFRRNKPGWKKASDGYDGICRACRSEYERVRQQMARLGLAMFGESHKIPGIDLCPCDEGGEICVYWRQCKSEEIMCQNFKQWSSTGRKNDLERVPNENIYGKKRIEI